MSEWSIEGELQSLSQTSSVEQAVISLGLLPVGQSLVSVGSDTGWVRGGAETYQYVFWVETESGVRHKYMLKACTATGALQGVGVILNEWFARRDLLSCHGVATPVLYASGDGSLLEEFIPYGLSETTLTDTMLVDLACLAGILSRLGFSPLGGCFADLRSRGNDVVVVDFGEDLGSPNAGSGRSSDLLSEVLSQLSKWNIDVDPSVLEAMHVRYQDAPTR